MAIVMNKKWFFLNAASRYPVALDRKQNTESLVVMLMHVEVHILTSRCTEVHPMYQSGHHVPNWSYPCQNAICFLREERNVCSICISRSALPTALDRRLITSF